MKWLKIPLLLLLIVVSFAGARNTFADEQLQRVLIMFETTIDQQLIEQNNGSIIEELPAINSVSALLPKNSIEVLQANKAIKYIEEDKPVSLQSYWSDWGTEKIAAQNAWTHHLTGQGVKVAVIDTGIAPHPDLNIKKGVSFVNYTKSAADDHGHGTHVAGIIAAGQQTQGLKGIAPDVELYAIKVLDKNGNGYHSDVIQGIQWAIEHEIDIINLSIGGFESSTFLEEALNEAYEEHNILIVAAAGNNGQLRAKGNTVDYPAKYASVIAVAATDNQDRHPIFSSHGVEVELAAPGVSIQSTHLDGGYVALDGTSMAAPHVTAMLALLKQAQPSKTNKELRKMIQGYTVDLGLPGKDSLFGYGRISFPEQIQLEAPRPSPPKNLKVEKKLENEKVLLTLTWEHEEATTFFIYRNQQKIAEVTDQFFYTDEKITSGPITYEITAINEAGSESAKTVMFVESDYAATANLYSDVNVSDWYISALHQLQSKKLIGGYPDGTFKPNHPVTRAELIVMIGRSLNIAGTKRATIYSDVNEQFFASGFIQTGQEIGLISGYPDGTFHPNHPVTREEAAVFLTRAFHLTQATTQSFPDLDPNHYTFSAILRTVGEGIATGYPDGTYHPKEAVTRAELATFLARALKYK